MSRKNYNKLIRDRIPEIIMGEGGVPEVSKLSDADYQNALKVKMSEEAKELLDAQTKVEVLNELVDIHELIRAIAANYGLSMAELEKKLQEKKQERGGFEKKLWLKYVDEQ